MANVCDEPLKCSSCSRIMSPPIFQCSSGHSVCGKCKMNPTVQLCNVCRMPITDMRNYQLEQLIETVKHKMKIECQFRHKGCTYKLKGNEKESHEKECRYGTHKCEANAFLQAGCSWTGDYESIYEHFVENHRGIAIANFKHAGTFGLIENCSWRQLQLINFSNGQHLFYCKFKVNAFEQKMYFWCKIIGLESTAQNYYYEVEIYCGDVKKIKHTAFCHGHGKSDKRITEEESCAVFTIKQLQQFKNSNNDINYRYRIMKRNNHN